MNKYKLRSKMQLFGDTYKKLAIFLGISPSALSSKINTYRGADFTQKEIDAIKNKYSLTPDELDAIFFN